MVKLLANRYLLYIQQLQHNIVLFGVVFLAT